MHSLRTLTGRPLLLVLRATALGGLALISVSCGAGPTPPHTTDDRQFNLVAINGRQVPTVLGENPTGRTEILSERYFLRSDGSYDRVEDFRNTDASGTRTGTIRESGNYVEAAGSIVFTRAIGANVFNTTALLTPAGFEIRYVAQGETLTYHLTGPR